jgi:hypothetical protein
MFSCLRSTFIIFFCTGCVKHLRILLPAIYSHTVIHKINAPLVFYQKLFHCLNYFKCKPVTFAKRNFIAIGSHGYYYFIDRFLIFHSESYCNMHIPNLIRERKINHSFLSLLPYYKVFPVAYLLKVEKQ